MHRRRFLQISGLSALYLGCQRASGSLSHVTHPSTPASLAGNLVLVELAGGNDGLNTVIPYTDPAYHAARPNIGVSRDAALPLSDVLALNPAMEALMPSWAAGQLAVVCGVGYPRPNRSHFRSIEIWETASESEETLSQGWIARALEARLGDDIVSDGVVLGDGEEGPLGGSHQALVMSTPGSFLEEATRLPTAEPPATHPALAHIVRVQNRLHHTSRVIQERLRGAPEPGVDFPRGPLGKQLEIAARLILADVPVPVFKVSHGGFDTHANQPGRHGRLLGRLAEGLGAFQRCMIEHGRWDETLVMTYSEFGRRVAENGSRGTDHGTAAPQLLLGGRVRGGIHGAQPSLTELEGGDLVHHIDFRALYQTIAARWWGLSDVFPGVRPLELIA